MGFYGNITNTSNTTFSFDKIYPNRLSMDAGISNDNIFIGRYVLVEYQEDAAYPVAFHKTATDTSSYGELYYFYSSPNKEDISKIKYLGEKQQSSDLPDEEDDERITYEDGFYKGEILQYYNPDDKRIEFYKCFIGQAADKNHYALFEKLDEEPPMKTNYIQNFEIDENHYSSGSKGFRGYDSTVWTKVSDEKDGKLITKYVHIADLNSVVPTFDIAEDAPTMNALTPHFDADSTNVYYKLHMQTPYGFRVKQVDNGKGSDLKTQHIKATYDINNNMIGKSAEEVNADIYYNKAGFEEETSSFKENGSDIITILPSGDSGKTYKHTPVLPDNMKDTEKWDGDIQELSIRLPSIGNTISKIWDIVYDNTKGYGGDNGTRKRDLDWQYVINDNTGELRVPQKGGKTLDVNTIAGCINSIHNLMGQIIVGNKPAANNANKNYIYFDNTKYWKIVDEYKYTELTGNINKNVTYYVISDANNIFTKGTIWNNKVTTIPTGVKIGTRTTINAWKELDLGKHFDTLHGQILRLNQAYSNALIDSETRNDNTIIGNINRLNDIIAKVSELVPGEIMVIDEYGRMHSAEYSTAQEYTSKNYGTSIDGEDTDSYEATEDRWINLNINTNYTNPSIKLVHNFTEVTDTTTISDKNGIINGNGINNNTDDKLQLYAPIVDATGHVVGKNIETVTLPYGYKTFTTEGLAPLDNENKEKVEDLYTTINNQVDGNNTSSSRASASTSGANNTQDSMAIEPYNKWIQTQLSDDKLVIAHEIHAINAEKSSTDLNDLKDNEIQNEINIPDWDYDEAGHIKKKGEHTYTLPYGYKSITIANDGNIVAAAPVFTTGTQTAKSTQDSLKLTTSNKWVLLDAGEENIVKFGHLVNDTPYFEGTYRANTNGVEKNIIEPEGQKPKFGKPFNILNVSVDRAGHVIDFGINTVTIPEGKYEIDTQNTNSTSLIVGMKLDGPTGEITTTSATTNTLQLSNYTYIGNGTKDTQTVANGQSINTALGILEKRINDLDYADPDANTTQFVSKVTEEEGIIKVERANVGGLVLTGYTASGKGNGEVGATDTINSAFAKIENKINTFLKDADLTTNAIDTLKELQTYIITHGTEANNMLNAINTIYKVENGAESGKLIDKTDALDKRINNLNSSVNATNGKYISSIIISNDTLSIGETALPTYTLKSGTANGTIKLNEEGNDVFVTGLGSAAFTEASAYVDATTYTNKIKELEDKIKELEDKIKELEDKLNPEPETPVEGE